jgi:hypothetical protein
MRMIQPRKVQRDVPVERERKREQSDVLYMYIKCTKINDELYSNCIVRVVAAKASVGGRANRGPVLVPMYHTRGGEKEIFDGAKDIIKGLGWSLMYRR